jgi:ADP-ribosyl-[dinitrogen reductase] hydrolase
MKNWERSAILGVIVGDALGVPVEFKSRIQIDANPVTSMIGYGTYNLPEGTWSDDSSLTLCLVQAISDGFDLEKIGQHFVRWLFYNYWTPLGNVFDVGIATRQAIYALKSGTKAELAGNTDENSNGNGSLMRILPLLFYIKNKSAKERFDITKNVSAITHGHIRSVLACFYYLEFARLICEGQTKLEAYRNTNEILNAKLKELKIEKEEKNTFARILNGNLSALQRAEIRGSGYVIHSLEASLWCLLTSSSYTEAVLKAVNLGEDTDTTGAITGGLAGLVYGEEAIPEKWIEQIARIEDIETIIEQFKLKLSVSF